MTRWPVSVYPTSCFERSTFRTLVHREGHPPFDRFGKLAYPPDFEYARPPHSDDEIRQKPLDKLVSCDMISEDYLFTMKNSDQDLFLCEARQSGTSEEHGDTGSRLEALRGDTTGCTWKDPLKRTF